MDPGPCLDEAVLTRLRAQRSEAFLARVIDLFLAEAPARLEEAWLGGRGGDARRAALATHALACLAGNVGAVAVRGLALEAEETSCAKGGAARLSVLLYDLEVALADARACLQAARRSLRGP